METFDELFDDFFKKNKKTRKKRKAKEESSDDKINKLIETLGGFKEITDKEKQDEIDNDLGKPNEIHIFKSDGMYFKRSVWHVEEGDLVKLEVSDEPFDENETLEELLQKALEEENYERAAEIRDEIEKNKKN